MRVYDLDEVSNGFLFIFLIEGIFLNIEDLNFCFGFWDDLNDFEIVNLLFFIGFFIRLVFEWILIIKVGDSGKILVFNEMLVFVFVFDVENENELFDGELIIIVNVYDGNFVGGIIGKVYY